MSDKTNSLPIRKIKTLTPPAAVRRAFPCTEAVAAMIAVTRQHLHRILHGRDDRLVVVVGPCSIHDPVAALEYAEKLQRLRARLKNELEIVMRVYFEKPRTTIGWKGFVNDPDLDGSFNLNKGVHQGRELLLAINQLGLPAGYEFLDTITSQYFEDLVSWGAIGARTSGSQIHRELASGLACPVGFKNGTDGNIKVAVDAVKTASQPHHFLSVTPAGSAAIVATSGNQDGHIVLRGGKCPNYDSANVALACQALVQAGQTPRLMIDASHANSRYDPRRQWHVLQEIGDQLAQGDARIMGVMIESYLQGGRQDLVSGQSLVYGQSITDGCIDWQTSVSVLENLAQAVQARRCQTEQYEFCK